MCSVLRRGKFSTCYAHFVHSTLNMSLTFSSFFCHNSHTDHFQPCMHPLYINESTEFTSVCHAWACCFCQLMNENLYVKTTITSYHSYNGCQLYCVYMNIAAMWIRFFRALLAFSLTLSPIFRAFEIFIIAMLSIYIAYFIYVPPVWSSHTRNSLAR